MSDFYADLQALSALRGEASRAARSSATLKRVAAEFEALFLQMILKNMRAAALSEGPFASSEQKHYLEWFDAQIAAHLSRHQGLGIARLLIAQLDPAPRRTTPGTGEVNPTGRVSRTTAAQTLATEGLGQSREQFVRTLWPHARRAAQALGVSPEVLLAQAALETGWGRFVPRHPDGRSSHNVFAIKAGPDWTGERVQVATLEYEDGMAVRRHADFRAYGSYEEAFADYVRLLTTCPRYRAALGQGEVAAFAGALQEAGYATDPDYARKIVTLAQHHLPALVRVALKSERDRPLT